MQHELNPEGRVTSDIGPHTIDWNKAAMDEDYLDAVYDVLDLMED